LDCSPPSSSVHGNFQARILEGKKKKKEYWRDCHFLLQGIFLTQGLKVFLAVAGKYFTPGHLGSWA